MSDLLHDLAAASAARVREARARVPEVTLRQLAHDAPAAPALQLTRPFELIAELKPISPASGPLVAGGVLSEAAALERARGYVAGGAAALSVLTEPTRFGGSLELLRVVSHGVTRPTLRKDFLVDPYQLLEARAMGAGGALLIVRILSHAQLTELIDAARSLGLWLVLETFDAVDLTRAAAVVSRLPDPPLVGVNTRNLATLVVDSSRLGTLAPALPPGTIGVAESGIGTRAQVVSAQRLGYRVGLVGEALMRADDARAAVASLLGAAP